MLILIVMEEINIYPVLLFAQTSNKDSYECVELRQFGTEEKWKINN